jgi:hypothetical protein
MDFLKLLSQARKNDDDDDKPRVTYSDQDLSAAYAKFMVKNTFAPGDLVCFKPGMATRKEPKICGIVVKVLTEPVIEKNDENASNHFMEPLDIIIGVFKDERFLTFHHDSRRLTHYKGTDTDLSTKLLASFSLITQPSSFKIGDIIQWKHGLKNRIEPKEGCHAVVTRVHSPAIISPDKSTGSAYFREELSITIGFIDNEGDFQEFFVPGDRFEVVSHVTDE